MAGGVRWSVSARGASVCWLNTTAWRQRQTPVTNYESPKNPLVSGFSVSRLKGVGSRLASWSGILQPVKAEPWQVQGTVLSLYPGVHERSVVRFRSVLSPKVRGLCSKKTKDTLDSFPAADPKEDSPVPGHGLFKFRELVSARVFDKSILMFDVQLYTGMWRKHTWSTHRNKHNLYPS